MNDHLEQLADVVSAARQSPTPPKKMSVVHYGPDGARVATTGEAAHSGEGTLSYTSSLAGGSPHGQSTVNLDPSGTATTASTAIFDPDGTKRATVDSDYQSLTLNEAGFAKEGTVTVRSTTANHVHHGVMRYEAERAHAYSVTNYHADGSTVTNHVHVDYSKTTMIANKIIGGSLQVNRRTPDNKLSNQAISNLDRSGTPSLVHATNFAADGSSAEALIESDYAGVLFDARRKIRSGKLLVTTRQPNGDREHETVFSYRHGKLTGRAPRQAGETIQRVTYTPPSVPGPWKPNRKPDQTKTLTRSDGTVLQVTRSWVFQGTNDVTVPQRTITTGYATDGTTVERVTDIDYGGAKFDRRGNVDGGTVVSTQFIGGVRCTVTNVTY